MNGVQSWWARMAPGSRQILVLVVVLVAAMFVERQRDPLNNIDEWVDDYARLAEQNDPSIDGDVTAGLRWSPIAAEPGLRLVTHDGTRFVGVGLQDGGPAGRELVLLTSSDGSDWERRVMGDLGVDTIGAPLTIDATGDVIVVQFQAFEPAPDITLRQSLSSLVAASADDGVTWVVSDPAASLVAPEAPYVTYQPTSGWVVAHEGDLYALASRYPIIDVRDAVAPEFRDAADCIFSSAECEVGTTLVDAAEALAGAGLPDATMRAIEADWLSTVSWSPDLGATWEPLPDLTVDGLSSLTAGDGGVLVATGLESSDPVLVHGSRVIGWTPIDPPAGFVEVGWVDSSGAAIYAAGFDRDGRAVASTLADGAWEPFIGPGNRDMLTDPAVGELGRIVTIFAPRTVDDVVIGQYAVAFRPAGGQWLEGPPLRDAPELIRLEFTVGRDSIVALAWPDYDPDGYERRAELMDRVDATRADYYEAIQTVESREAWLLTPVAD